MKVIHIFEQLKGTHNLRNLTWEELVEYLKTHNVSRIGQGAFGDVFYHPSWNYVVKVFDTDTAYLNFIKFVEHNPNKHYPKILKSPKLMHQFHKRNLHRSDMHKFFYLVKIEKLLPLSLENQDMVHELAVTIGGNYRNHFNNRRKFISSMRELISRFPKQEMATLSVAIFKALEFLKANVPETVADLHSGNFMQRPDGTIVVIDPVSCLNDSDPYFKEPLEQHVVQGINL